MKATLSAHEAYDLWADTYPPVAHNPLMRVEQQVVEPLLSHIRARRALDVGTGSGRYLPLLQATGAAKVVGLDFSLAMLRRGSGAPGRVCGDACRLPFSRASFDPDQTRRCMRPATSRTCVVARDGAGPDAQRPPGYSDFHPSWAQHGWSRTFRSARTAPCTTSPSTRTRSTTTRRRSNQAGLRVRAIREPRLTASRDDRAPAIKLFRRRSENPQVVIVFHVVKEP